MDKVKLLRLDKKTFTLKEVSEALGMELDITPRSAYQRLIRAIYSGKISAGLNQYFGEYRLDKKLVEDILNGQVN